MKAGVRKKAKGSAAATPESAIERLSRLARARDAADRAREPTITPETGAQGDYHEAWAEHDGERSRVLLNRGGSTVQRWLNAPPCDILGDSERSAIRYCLGLWHKIDRRGISMIRVDNGRAEGLAEYEALAELAGLKDRLPRRHWDLFEMICRFEQPAPGRQSKVVVGMVASLIALWRGL